MCQTRDKTRKTKSRVFCQSSEEINDAQKEANGRSRRYPRKCTSIEQRFRADVQHIVTGQ